MQNPRSRRNLSSGGRIALTALIVLVGMVVVLGRLWWTAAVKTPQVTIPNPTLPSPNGFDFYVKASGAIINAKQIGDASAGTYATVKYTLAQKEALVQQNAGAINTLHQGFGYPYLNPPCRTIYEPLTYYSKFRDLVHLLALQGQVRAAKGDWSGATESYLDAIRMGEEIPHGAILIGELTGRGCQAVGRKPLWSAIEPLNAAQSRAAAQRLEAVLERHLPYVDTIQEEKWWGQGCRLEVFDHPEVRDALFIPNNDPDDPKTARAASFSRFLYLIYSKRRIMEDFTTYMDAVSAQVRQPYAAKLPPPLEPEDPFNQAMMIEYYSAWFRDVQNETQNRLLLITLALHAFRAEHGRYPATLAGLAPSYLKRLPDDPFAKQGTFLYRVEGKRYLLYSVGPDGKDDNGTPIDNPDKATSTNPNARYNVSQNSTGDEVAGKNR